MARLLLGDGRALPAVVVVALLVVVVALVSVATADDGAPYTREALEKLPVEQLIQVLDEWDISCPDCEEPEEFINRIIVTQQIRALPQPVEPVHSTQDHEPGSEKFLAGIQELQSREAELKKQMLEAGLNESNRRYGGIHLSPEQMQQLTDHLKKQHAQPMATPPASPAKRLATEAQSPRRSPRVAAKRSKQLVLEPDSHAEEASELMDAENLFAEALQTEDQAPGTTVETKIEGFERFDGITRQYAQERNRSSEVHGQKWDGRCYFLQMSLLSPFARARTHPGLQRIESDIPERCKIEPCVLGVDEAGRGPVLGPMVYAVAFAPLSENARMKKLGFADSKQLSEAKRDELFKVIKENADWMGWKVHMLAASDISAGMLSRTKHNLNAQAHESTVDLVKRLHAQGVQIKEDLTYRLRLNHRQLYVDTVGKAHIYQQQLENWLRPTIPNIKIVVESKLCVTHRVSDLCVLILDIANADVTYPIVSAASICAKVTRDAVLTYWRHPEQREIDNDFGCGYPGDSSTKAWLRKVLDPIFGFPSLVRFSWSTARDLLLKEGTKIEWEDDGDEDDDEAQNKLSFVKPRHGFFHRRGFKSVVKW
ncbi:uncharacterized protein MONBRDRAFT_25972 [Monosiga brevicollis MX1]|uniref:Ribonuclease n=1 Tax=Monosiga brevicollis TaxID=81824 RepID=A9V104_MONBE|nr:uncharacterized protein MONBRDRAFT_25972 [Monosiga brevicollis MX1]EDQ88723.1 predicted protein [Monosiga brevicollis MX1]|eukprot:XP_001746336.1 hypothetical protein [Monosiga brevicollis MX1]